MSDGHHASLVRWRGHAMGERHVRRLRYDGCRFGLLISRLNLRYLTENRLKYLSVYENVISNGVFNHKHEMCIHIKKFVFSVVLRNIQEIVLEHSQLQ